MSTTMSPDRIAVVSFDAAAWTVRVHEFNGEVANSFGDPCVNRWALTHQVMHGMGIERFLELITVQHFDAPDNKEVGVAVLRTWIWAAVVGNDGNMRGRPRMIRHTTPDGGRAFWILKKDPRQRGYLLEPLKEFECGWCGRRFERYAGQEELYCSECWAEAERLAAKAELA